MPVFRKVLVANPGEIAIRVFRTLRELGIATVAVYSAPDRGSAHVAYAAEAFLVDSYLDQEAIFEVAQRAGAEAIHPGYGFLAENAGFARSSAQHGIVWIGPPPDAIEAMGSKIEARERMRAAGVPIVPGVTSAVSSADEVRRLGDELGWPIAIKASAGGGGKGLKVVTSPDRVERAFEAAQREGDPEPPASDRVVEGACRREAAETGGDGLGPRLQASEIASLQDDPALECGQPEARDQKLARHDRGHHPAREHISSHEHDEHRQDEQLVGDRVEKRSQRGGTATAPG